MQILCSTGAFVNRKNGRDPVLIPVTAEKLCCDGLELMMYDTWYDRTDELVAVTNGFSVPVLHVDKQVGEKIGRGEPGDREAALRDFRKNCVLARRVGAGTLVLHLWNGLPSDHHFDRQLSVFGKLSRIAASEGVCLTVENVVCGAATPLQRLFQLKEQYPDVQFTFDTKMAAFHHELDAVYTDEYAWLWSGAVRHLHLNDYGGGYRDWDHLRVLHPNAGWVDLKKFCRFVRQKGYDGAATSEAAGIREDGSVDTDRLNQTLLWYKAALTE